MIRSKKILDSETCAKIDPETYIIKNFLVGIADGAKKGLFNFDTKEAFQTFRFSLENTINEFIEMIVFRCAEEKGLSNDLKEFLRNLLSPLKTYQEAIQCLTYEQLSQSEDLDNQSVIPDEPCIHSFSLYKRKNTYLTTICEETEATGRTKSFTF